MKITLRQLAGLVAAVPAMAAKRPVATVPESPPPPAPARADGLSHATAAVRKLAVPAQTEPAFSFRAQ
jgi:hypothetical protein